MLPKCHAVRAPRTAGTHGDEPFHKRRRLSFMMADGPGARGAFYRGGYDERGGEYGGGYPGFDYGDALSAADPPRLTAEQVRVSGGLEGSFYGLTAEQVRISGGFEIR